MTTGRVVTENVTCLGCGCACDDIAVVVEHARIVEARNACALGIQWFGDGTVPTRVRVDGRDVPLREAMLAAGQTLAGAARPLVYLAPDISCEAQRHGAAIADLLRGVLDTATSATALPAMLSAQERGYASSTLGEIRNRADTIVFWAADTAQRYPRFASRYAPEPAGTHIPDGRRSRTVVAVDVGSAAGPAEADRRVAIDAADELTALTALSALVSAREDGGAGYASCSGAAWDRARELATVLLAGRYVALVYDAEDVSSGADGRSVLRFDALTTLAQALNARTRAAAIALRAGGNRSGADATLTAQTGYPLAVDFSRGHPRYRPHDGSALARLARGDVDAALVLGSPALLPAETAAALGGVPCVVIGPRASDASLGSAHVVIDTGVAGIHSGGTALRMDDVPLPLRPPLAGPPNAADVARELASLIRQQWSSGEATQPARGTSGATPVAGAAEASR